MTFTYSKHVSSVHLLGFVRLLFIWRASIYKLVFREIIIYCAIYGSLSMTYRLLLSTNQRKIFEQVVVFCSAFEEALPLTFILGFYVSFVANRWWQQFSNIAYPDRIMTYIATMVEGSSERAIIIRRTLIRYLFLSQCMLMRSISSPVRKRFPDLESFIAHGIMTEDELDAINDERVPTITNNYWVPMHWFASLLVRARNENFIKDSYSFNTLINELTAFKTSLKNVMLFDMINVPLGYTQVATISVYGFSFITLLSRQFIDWTSIKEQLKATPSVQYSFDMYFPVFTVLQLFFYIGWLNVAEQMLNPFGEDDDDFECNWILDRNFTIGFCGVDALYQFHPPLIKDAFWNNFDANLSYTIDSEKYRLPDGWHGSAHVPNAPVSTQKDNNNSNLLARRKSQLVIVQSNNALKKSNARIPLLSFDDKISSNASIQSVVQAEPMIKKHLTASTPSLIAKPYEPSNFSQPISSPILTDYVEQEKKDHSSCVQVNQFGRMKESQSFDLFHPHIEQKKSKVDEEFHNFYTHSSSACQLSIVDESNGTSTIPDDQHGTSSKEISITVKSCSDLDSDSIV